MKLKTIIGALLSLSLLVSACGTNNLQGRFSVQNKGGVKVKSVSTSELPAVESKTSKLLTVTPSASTHNTITLSKVDFDYEYNESDPFDVDPTWFAIGKYAIDYADGATNCAERDLDIRMNDGSTTYQYTNVTKDMFANVRLQFRTANDDFLGYVYPIDSSLSTFSFTNAYTYDSSTGKYAPGTLSLTGNNYFYVEAQAKSDASSRWKNKNLYVYMSEICAMKSSSKYYWWYDDASSQNSYFNATKDATLGITGGWGLVSD